MSQQYSLRWNNHQPNFISMFTTLLNTQTLVDVTLAAEGKHLQAHKVVLSACSTYFQALFVDNPSRHPIVILKDVTFADLRTMVDFMYYGEVNVTEEQLPQVLDTAKLLKIKGLTEMPDSTSLTRAQGGPSAEFQQPPEPDPPRILASPATSPSTKRKRRRKSSTGSASLNMVDEARGDENQTMELVRDGITLSSVPQRRRDFHDERHQETSQQTPDNAHNLHMDPLGVENTPGMTQGGQWSMMEHAYPRYSNACGLGGGSGGGGGMQADGALYMNNVMNPHMEGELGEYAQALGGVAHASPGPSCNVETPLSQDPPPPAQQKRRRTTNPQSEENFQRALEASFAAELKLRRSKNFKRQNRVPEEGHVRQASDPTPAPSLAPPSLRKHESYPQYTAKNRRVKSQEPDMVIRSVSVLDLRGPLPTPSAPTGTSSERTSTEVAPRAKHTPAVRSGPPLSCNFCWNTVDNSGRILRRKTQYHCPECRTNLCIVPCFHEYHEGENEPTPNAR